jgi:polyisoprenoid-binding protein YceI
MSDTATTPISSIPGLVAGVWELDTAHTQIGFTVRHLMSKVRGTFTEFSGEIVVKDTVQDSVVSVSVDLSSIDTRNAQRDGHVRSSDFFNVDVHPKMTFVSTGARRDGDDWILTGELTIKDYAKPVELKVEYLGVDQNPYGQTIAGFEATTSISRKDWGIDFNIPTSGDKLLIGDKVDIHLTVEAALQA